MSDQPPHSEPDPAPAVADPEPTPAASPRDPAVRPLWAAVAVLALVVVVGGTLLWRQTHERGAQLAALQDRLNEADARVGKLEALPPPDLTPLQRSVAELGSKVTALANKPPPQATLDDASRQQLAAVSGRIDSVTARQDQLGTAEQADVAKLNDQISALTAKIAAVGAQADASTKASSAVTALSAKATRTAQLQAAAAALAAGRPLGNIPDAPAALAKFATQAPPTEASLRLSFDSAAQAARQAGQPISQTVPFFARMWQRAESSVTVKAGNTLVVGDALADTLQRARGLLDAGDLAGAVSALGALSGPAAQAVAPWREQAQSLLDARAALISAADR